MNRMNKIVSDFIVSKNIRISDTYSRLVLTEIRLDGVNSIDYNEIKPGQFVEVRVDGNKTTFLRRPISINYVVPERREIHLLVRKAGDGTKALCDCSEGDVINMMLPLGNGFSLPTDASNEKDTHLPYRPLLIGGGVGVAPLLHLGKILNSSGIRPTFLLAAKTAKDLLETERFDEFGDVVISTDDGSAGTPGLVTQNPILNADWDMFYCCGPMPMMKAVARIAMDNGVPCEVSLENSMACGLGACLCCVEDTIDGHVCVCTHGPVFDVKTLKWF